MDEAVYKRMAVIQEHHWWYEARRQIIGSVIAGLKLPPRARILEAGCGTGANLNLLKTFGDVEAFEPFEFAVTKAASISGCRVETGLLPDGIPFAGTYNLVGAFDVIEHVEADLASLKALAAHTAKGGYGIYTVPAFKSLWSRHDEVNQHFRRYRRAEFKTLLEAAGYKVEFISYYNTLLFPAVVVVRILKKLLGIQDQPDEEMPSDGMNKLLRLIFASERWLLKFTALPFGVSIIAVCRKP